MHNSDDTQSMLRSETAAGATSAMRSKLSHTMQVMLLTAVILLLGVGLMSTSWATPEQGAPATIPTRTPEPITVGLAVTLQRPNSPPPSAPWSVPVHLAFYPPDDATTVAGEWDVTLDQSGRWSGGANLFPGNYDVRIKNLHTLRNVKRNVAVAQGVTIDMGMLREGDADNDNRVRAADFALLRAAYFKNAGDPAFDPRTDFDEDQRVRSSDFALLRSNYFASGDIEVVLTAAQALTAQPQGTVALAIEPAQVTVRPGEIFTLTVMAHAGVQPFVGLDLVIRFPAAHLQIVGVDGLPAAQIEPSPALDVLYNYVDNAQGTINYSAGILGDSTSGDVSVARLRFRVVHGAASMPIEFGEVLVSDPDGKWVTGPLSGAIASMTETRSSIYLPIVLSASQ